MHLSHICFLWHSKFQSQPKVAWIFEYIDKNTYNYFSFVVRKGILILKDT